MPSISNLSILLTSIVVVLAAEIPCMTRTAILTEHYGHPILIALGNIIGSTIMMVLGVLVGEALHNHVPESYIKWTSGLFFVIFGLLMLFGKIKG